MKKFYPIGSKLSNADYGECILAQTGSGMGTMISLQNGNRISEPTELTWEPKIGYGLYSSHPYIEEFIQPEKKPDVILFHRYIRPRNFWGEVDNMRGVTVAVELDYNQRLARFGISICDGDNFNKDLGRYIAEQRLWNKEDPFYYVIPIENGIPKCGSVNLLISSLTSNWEYLDERQQRICHKLLYAYVEA